MKYLDLYQEISSDEGKALAEKYRSALKVFFSHSDSAVEEGMKNHSQEALANLAKADQARDEMREIISKLRELTSSRMDRAAEDAKANVLFSLWSMALAFGVAGLASVGLSLMTIRSLSRSMNDIVKRLTDGSLQVTSASSQIASSAEELSQSSTEQAASLEETAASVEEMNSMIAKNTENAVSTASLAKKSAEASERGQAVVTKMIDAMGQIDKSNATILEQVNESNQQIAGIVKVVEQIAKKTQVINEIVNKTELLSFNASVEAARAGEHGKGFAVVAEEVGNLARMSGAAAEEIASLLDGSIENVNRIIHETSTKVGAMIESGKRSVQAGTDVARECGEVLEEIVDNVRSVTTMSTEIASASTEQSRGITEITKAMNQLDQMTQQNAATSEESASAAEELSAQAESLKTTVIQLVGAVRGAKSIETMDFNPGTAAGPAEQREFRQRSPASKPNVVKLTSKKTAQGGDTPPAFKRAAGDAPSYDNDGFKKI